MFVQGNAAELFQSTLPVRGATPNEPLTLEQLRISIHAPREGSDLPADTAMCATGDFNPRSP